MVLSRNNQLAVVFGKGFRDESNKCLDDVLALRRMLFLKPMKVSLLMTELQAIRSRLRARARTGGPFSIAG
ncbi:predicted protein [Sclerotinia sclerotiorum 1980 UF-70]|uniref:Uncharacterized protein n=1 Tax=Sclerotinia sclerotiorum (strain ATCC 18683 / 1980 / Ss-1) TaxID=665079 RepID=A7EY30_SCLS1|nr:predicted protein [Sclerotinia sclerotiorum 1980 UF-70]EDN94372.1 predicted protein [Sclerotinia sclerotiorum 1980 UF-70]